MTENNPEGVVEENPGPKVDPGSTWCQSVVDPGSTRSRSKRRFLRPVRARLFGSYCTVRVRPVPLTDCPHSFPFLDAHYTPVRSKDTSFGDPETADLRLGAFGCVFLLGIAVYEGVLRTMTTPAVCAKKEGGILVATFLALPLRERHAFCYQRSRSIVCMLQGQRTAAAVPASAAVGGGQPALGGAPAAAFGGGGGAGWHDAREARICNMFE
eukprot:gene5996-biopygen4298